MIFYLNAMTISFGKKIPLYQTQVFDRTENKFKKATLSEFDCRDSEDIDYVALQHDAWDFKYAISVDMFEKNRKLNNLGNISSYDRQNLKNNRFFVLEDEKNEMLGLCETTGINQIFNVQYLESNKSKKVRFKFIGQNLLAGVSKQILSSEHKEPVLSVLDPAYTAVDFYREKCGFKNVLNYSLKLEKDGLADMVSSVEERVQTPLIDLNA
ncbi:hypothetical protein IKQ26_02975 [bacterium]|nr:hypothetical protein [bacterium]